MSDQNHSLTDIDTDPESPKPTRKNGGVVIVLVGVLALLGLLAWGLIQSQKGPVDTGEAPDFTITGFDGRTVTLSELR
ncbi:MAG: hypothetical protein KKC71_05395, partial [Chloroflexi bacterium]|nr:hypothetical protein [Chloroflexota bacterium]